MSQPPELPPEQPSDMPPEPPPDWNPYPPPGPYTPPQGNPSSMLDPGRMPDYEHQLVRLWNPGAAINWSLLLSGCFGATLHAINCRTLGDEHGYKANRRWVVIQALYFAFLILINCFPISDAFALALNSGAFGLLAGWYYDQGKKQVQFVKDHLGNRFIPRGWGSPIGIGLAGIMAYTVAIVIAFTLIAPMMMGHRGGGNRHAAVHPGGPGPGPRRRQPDR